MKTEKEQLRILSFYSHWFFLVFKNWSETLRILVIVLYAQVKVNQWVLCVVWSVSVGVNLPFLHSFTYFLPPSFEIVTVLTCFGVGLECWRLQLGVVFLIFYLAMVWNEFSCDGQSKIKV